MWGLQLLYVSYCIFTICQGAKMERFWNKVYKTESCWLWVGAKTPKGYGQFCHEGKIRRAHRLAYVLAFGEIPAELFVCHKCDNPSCVRPKHLFLGTNRDNVMDAIAKYGHYQSDKTHCIRGHAFDKNNTGRARSRNSVVRYCKKCHAATARSQRRKTKSCA
jgi:hypothetical protein